jgi:hypothetical protein
VSQPLHCSSADITPPRVSVLVDRPALINSEVPVPVQVIMDYHGDSRHLFEPDDRRSTFQAEARFNDLRRKGFIAVEPGKSGEPGRLLSGFNPSVEETLFIPPLQGG